MFAMAEPHLAVREPRHGSKPHTSAGIKTPVEKQEGISKLGGSSGVGDKELGVGEEGLGGGGVANWEGKGGRLFNSRMMGQWRGARGGWSGNGGGEKKQTQMRYP